MLKLFFIVFLMTFTSLRPRARAVTLEEVAKQLGEAKKNSSSDAASDTLFAEVPVGIDGMEETDDNGFTILLTAAMLGQYEELKNYIKAGANVNHTNSDGNSALHLTARGGYYHSSRELINGGADLNIKNTFGVTPLMLAISGGHHEIAVALLEGGADVNTVIGRDKTPALTVAAQTGSLRVVQKLIEKGAKVDKRSTSGETALIFSSAAGHFTIVECLLKAGANYALKNSKGYTALIFAAARGQHKVIEVLIKKNQEDLMQQMEDQLRVESAKKHSKKSFDAAQSEVVPVEDIRLMRDRYERTALDHASDNNRQDAINTLVAMGAPLPASGFRVDHTVMEKRYKYLQDLHDQQIHMKAQVNKKKKAV